MLCCEGGGLGERGANRRRERGAEEHGARSRSRGGTLGSSRPLTIHPSPPPPPPTATIASLALGRFIIMPQQRAAVKKAGLPQQNGKTHEAAGDKLAGEATFALATNDPAGFTLGE